MDEYVGLISFEADGRVADVVSVTPSSRTYRERIETMNGSGFVKRRPQYGLTVVVAENNNFSKNPFWENMENGTLVIIYKNGRREVYPQAACLSASHGGYSVNGNSEFTYEFMTAKPQMS
jgi:hypothetical protein